MAGPSWFGDCGAHARRLTLHGKCQACEADVLAAEVRKLRAENEHLRATQTTGGPPPAFTPGWTPGASSRPPTAPPEPEVVELDPLTRDVAHGGTEYPGERP